MEQRKLAVLSDVHAIDVDVRSRCRRRRHLFGVIRGEFFEHVDIPAYFTIAYQYVCLGVAFEIVVGKVLNDRMN